MRYRMFYNFDAFGDTLLILIHPEKKPDRVEDKNGVTALYLGDELLGYNIFDLSRVLKLKAKGIIFTPGVELVTLVNQLLTAAGFPVLEELTDSGFHVFKVTKIEEHPLDEKAKIVTLTDGKDTYETVTKLNNLNADDKVVGLIDGYIAPDGMMFLKHVDHNIKNDVLLLSEKALKQGEDEKEIFKATKNEAGDDFFLGR